MSGITRRGVLQTGTDYGPYLANEPSPLHTTTIVDRCTEKLVDDWNKMRANVRPPAICSLPMVLSSSAAGSAGQITINSGGITALAQTAVVPGARRTSRWASSWTTAHTAT